MHQFFQVSIKDETVLINTDNNKNIVAKFNDNELIIKNLDGTARIKLEQLQQLVGQERFGKIHLYYREIGSSEEIIDTKIKIVDNIELLIDSSLMTNFNENQWIFYLTKKGTFNCIFNKVPSYQSYYLDNHLKEVKLTDDDLHIELNLETKYLKANTLELILRNRQTKEEISVTGNVSLLEKTNHNYLQVATIKISQLDLCQVISNQNNTTDSDKLDAYIRIEYLESTVKDKKVRVKYSKENESHYAQELWSDKLNGVICGFFPYFTKNLLNFSFHTTILSKEAYKTYINFTKTNNKANRKKIFVVGE
jgi:hypothetical protein